MPDLLFHGRCWPNASSCLAILVFVASLPGAHPGGSRAARPEWGALKYTTPRGVSSGKGTRNDLGRHNFWLGAPLGSTGCAAGATRDGGDQCADTAPERAKASAILAKEATLRDCIGPAAGSTT